MPKTISPFTRTSIEIKQIKQIVERLEATLNQPSFRFSDPFEFAKLYNAKEYKVLLYYKQTYFDRKGKDKGILYDMIKPDITKERFMKDISDQDLPRYLLKYEVNVVLAVELGNGDLLTTLGHLISPKSYTIRMYKSRINNIMKVMIKGKVVDVNLGKLMIDAFVEQFDFDKKRVLYKDGDFTNNRIENLELEEQNENE